MLWPGRRSLRYYTGLHGLEQICRRRLADRRLSNGRLFCNKSVSSDTARRITTLNGSRVRRISLVGKEKVYGGNDLPKSQALSSE